jgi:hypothetical protein
VAKNYEWNPKWNKDPNYNCTTCKHLGESGGLVRHWGCFYDDRYQRWVPQRLAKRKAVCTVPEERRKFVSPDVHWEPIKGQEIPVVAKPLARQSKLSSDF